MNPREWLDAELCVRLAVTLGHFLWQGAAVCVLALLAGALLRKRSAQVRYGVHVAALVTMAACLPVTYAVLRGQAAQPTRRAAVDGPAPAVVDATMNAAVRPGGDEGAGEALPATPPLALSATAAPARPAGFTQPAADPAGVGELTGWDRYAKGMVGVYLAGVAAMLGRLLLGLQGGRRLRRRSEPVEDAALLGAIARRARAMGLAAAPAIAYCGRVAVPTVVGIVRPMILLPVSFLTGLTTDDAEVLIAHELAHIRRYDHLVNLVQRLIEAVLFFHPAVWIVSRKITLEREHCCDDMVIAGGTERTAYASSLVRMAETCLLTRRNEPAIAVASLAVADRPSRLRRRIIRLLDGPCDQRVRLRSGFSLPIVLLALVAAVVVVELAATATPDANPSESTQQNTSEADQAAAGAPFVAQLPNGATIELIGVASGAGRTADRTWWKADGSPLSEPPYGSARVASNEPNPYQFAVRVQGSHDFDCRVVSPARAACVTATAPGMTADGLAASGLRCFVLSRFAEGCRSTDIVLQLATAPYEKVTAWPNVCEGVPDDVVTFANPDIGAVIAAPKQDGPYLRMELSHTYVDSAARLVVFDRKGELHIPCQEESGGEGKGLVRRIYRFKDVPLAEVDRFELQRRPYEWSATFRNVSLRPGGKTDVSIEVGPSDEYLRLMRLIQLQKERELVEARRVRQQELSSELLARTRENPRDGSGSGGYRATLSERPLYRPRHSVMLVVGSRTMTFEGQATTWEQLPVLLDQVPARHFTVLALGIAADDAPTTAQFKEAKERLSKLREALGFEYLSLVGEHRLGEKGAQTHYVQADREDMGKAGETELTRTPPGRPHHAVRLVVGAERMTFQGRDVTWDELPAVMSVVPDRKHTDFEIAAASDSPPPGGLQAARDRVGPIAKAMGFATHADGYIGDKPLGSMGPPTHYVVEERTPTGAATPSGRQPTPGNAVRLVVGPDRLTFNGEQTDWEQLAERLGRMTDRGQAVFEFAIASDSISAATSQQALWRARKLSSDFGFAEFREVELQPTQVIPTDPSPPGASIPRRR